MKTRHRTTVTVLLAAVVAVGGVALPLWSLTAEAQHGHAPCPGAHFTEIAALTDGQRETLSVPFHQAFAAIEELHRLHGEIARELTDERKGTLSERIHSSPGGSLSSRQHGQPHQGEDPR